MSQTTSELWKALWRTRGTVREYGFDIAGKWYGPEQEVSHTVDSGLYDQFGIGNATTAKLTISLLADSIPRAAKIPGAKESMIRIKQELRERGLYGFGEGKFISMDVYRAVLEQGIISTEQFLKRYVPGENRL